MWQTPESIVSPLNSTPASSSFGRAAATSATRSAIGDAARRELARPVYSCGSERERHVARVSNSGHVSDEFGFRAQARASRRRTARPAAVSRVGTATKSTRSTPITSSRPSDARRVAVVEHQGVAVGILEERHVADARVEGLAVELDALRLELGARGGACPRRAARGARSSAARTPARTWSARRSRSTSRRPRTRPSPVSSGRSPSVST